MPTPDDPAASAAADNVTISPVEASKILRNLIAESYAVGAHTAKVAVGGGAKVTESLTALESATDWDAWQPGHIVASDLVADGGLQTLLDNAGITIKSAIDNAIDRVGNVLADGLAAGDSVDTIASSLSDAVSANAYMIADTESARAMETASQATYDANGIEQWQWLAEPDACPECLDNADNGPYDVGDGPDLPAHPLDRCASVPITGYETSDDSDTTDDDTDDTDQNNDSDTPDVSGSMSDDAGS